MFHIGQDLNMLFFVITLFFFLMNIIMIVN